ncbi:MAG: FMN-binding protein [Flavobacteriales bacterium]|nr:FMN-binding protein [Flavobacteriales bacterium]
MNTGKTSYIYIFTVVVVLMTAMILSVASLMFSERHSINAIRQSQKDILRSLHIQLKDEQVEKTFPVYVKDTLYVDTLGNVIQPNADTTETLRLYIAEKNDSTLYVIPVKGYGLWGQIWGYVALEEDFNTIYGATYDHKSETSGLGAEISTDQFTTRFKGKKLYDEASTAMFTIVKTPVTDLPKDQQQYAVDGITGATITSEGVKRMLREATKAYLPFFLKEKQKKHE